MELSTALADWLGADTKAPIAIPARRAGSTLRMRDLLGYATRIVSQNVAAPATPAAIVGAHAHRRGGAALLGRSGRGG